VNLFAPNPVPITPNDYRAYAALLQPEADPYGINLGTIGLREDDDQWEEKIALLLAGPVPGRQLHLRDSLTPEHARKRRHGRARTPTSTPAVAAAVPDRPRGCRLHPAARQSRHLHQALTRAGGLAALTVLPGAQHPSSVNEDVQRVGGYSLLSVRL